MLRTWKDRSSSWLGADVAMNTGEKNSKACGQRVDEHATKLHFSPFSGIVFSVVMNMVLYEQHMTTSKVRKCLFVSQPPCWVHFRGLCVCVGLLRPWSLWRSLTRSQQAYGCPFRVWNTTALEPTECLISRPPPPRPCEC